ncbi:hypothetical protein RRG08_003548 [Elysia crispata]|uniref:Uncharacterized protein n=1 Tax=Elysia crispata TaxID=231223 RepID=A0AAE0Y6L3_9GAST|nr:hypothetical protein RRG08_003548 [Elysia crispata]
MRHERHQSPADNRGKIMVMISSQLTTLTNDNTPGPPWSAPIVPGPAILTSGPNTSVALTPGAQLTRPPLTSLMVPEGQ